MSCLVALTLGLSGAPETPATTDLYTTITKGWRARTRGHAVVCSCGGGARTMYTAEREARL